MFEKLMTEEELRHNEELAHKKQREELEILETKVPKRKKSL